MNGVDFFKKSLIYFRKLLYMSNSLFIFVLSITNNNNQNNIDMKFTAIQIEGRVENLGGLVIENRAYFAFSEDVSKDNNETITLQSALDIESKMMDLGFAGALIGTPYNDNDPKGIFFEI